MKRFFVSFFIIMIGILLTPNFYSVYADNVNDELEVLTIYTDDILEYQNIDGISKLAVGENYIAYSLDNENIKVFNINTKTYGEIPNNGTISKLEMASDNLLIASDTGVRAVDLNSLYDNTNTAQIQTLNIMSNQNIVDFYVDNDTIYVGYINDNTFKLTEYYLNLSIKEQTRTIYTDNESKLNSVKAVTLNDTTAHIFCGDDSKVLYKLYKLDLSSPSPTLIETITTVPFSIIDTFYYNNVPYVMAFAPGCLYLYNNSLMEICNTPSDPNSGAYLHVSDFDFYNNKIYVARTSEGGSGYIQEYTITTKQDESTGKTETVFASNNPLICSKGSEAGRFNEASGLTVSGDTIFVADSNNKSIHIVYDDMSKLTTTNLSLKENIENLQTLGDLTLDKDLNLYIVANIASNSSIVKYTYNKATNTYDFANNFDNISSQKIGSISSISSYQSTIYALDHTQNKLLLISKDVLNEANLDSKISLDSNSKIACLKSSEDIVIYSNNNLYLINNTGKVLSEISTPRSFKSITTDYDKIYGVCDNKVYSYSLSGQTIINDNKITEADRLENVNIIHYDIATRKMYGFDSNRGCLVNFSFNSNNTPFSLNDIASNSPLTQDSTILPITIKNSPIIYEYPNCIGMPYNKDGKVTTCIGIEEIGEEYRILFNSNGKLASGFIPKTSAQLKEYDCNEYYKVITINKKVPVYKYPTLLKWDNEIIKIDELELKTSINIKSDKFPVSIDGKSFYEYEDSNGKIGYIFLADIVSDDSKNITYIESNNATIKVIGNNEVTVYAEDKEEELLTLKNSTRVYVEEYSSDSEYTKIKYIDSNQKTTIGYIKTEYIEMDKLDDTKIVLIIVIVVSSILLLVIAVSYIIIKKKRS